LIGIVAIALGVVDLPANPATTPATRPAAARRKAEDCEVSGTIYDADHKAVADAEVWLVRRVWPAGAAPPPTDPAAAPVARTRSDAKGRYTLRAPADSYAVLATERDHYGAGNAGRLLAGTRRAVPVRLDSPATADITVTSASNTPLAGATVVLVSSGIVPQIARSDANGHATLTNLPPAEYYTQIWLAGERFSESQPNVTIAPGAKATLAFQCKALASPREMMLTLKGRVTRADGQPAVGVAVSAIAYRPNQRIARWHPLGLINPSSQRGDAPPLVRTDADGRFAISGSPAANRLLVSLGSAPGDAILFYAADVSKPAAGDSLEIQLPPVGEVAVVVRGADGKPAVGATVARPAMGDASYVPTDAAGRTTFHSLQETETISAGLAGLWAQTAVKPIIGGQAEAQIALPRGGSATGNLLFADGAPADGFELRTIAEKVADGARPFAGIAPDATTAADGRFTISNLPVGRYRLEAELPMPDTYGRPDRALLRAQSEPFEIVAGGETPVDFYLRTGSLAVTVVDAAGKPVADVAVEMRRNGTYYSLPTLTTDAGGVAHFHGAPPARYLVRVNSRAGVLAAVPGEVAIDAHQNKELRIQLPPTGTIRGKAVDSQGRPLPGVHAYLQCKELQSGAEVVSDGDGEFSLAGLPIGAYMVLPEFEGRRFIEVSAGALTAGALIDVELKLVSGTVAGRCLDLEGKPVPGARITVGAVNRFGAGTTTDADGRFRIGRVPAGAYTLTASLQRADPKNPRHFASPSTTETGVTVSSDAVLEVEVKLPMYTRN
jgi:protocatechuate 3,4-dioxygenase beta subunit